jgi:long-chain acyl-CoA synthetase
MDLRLLLERLSKPERNNAVLAFERGQVIRKTHADVLRDVRAAQDRLAAWGIRAGMRVGIRAPNSYEWMIHDLALIALRAVSLAFTDDFVGMPAADLCRKYGLSLLLVSSCESQTMERTEAPVACLDGENGPVAPLARGEATSDPDFERPFLIFSSGSAGGVKGLVLNRRGIESSVEGFVQAAGPRHDDCLLLFLPMSNFQQRMMYYAALWYGFDIIVTDPPHVFRALKELHPTMLVAPPALYEAFEARFASLPGWKRRSAEITAEIIGRLPVRRVRKNLARVVFKDAYDALGGRMRFLVTGMAPTRHSTLRLFERMQLPMAETYGLIECGSISLSVEPNKRLASVGRLLPGVEVQIAEDGELIVRREPTLAFGYFECANGEAERTFLGGNRIATGDIGRFDEDGYLYLTGRKKEIIFTAGGEKIHPEVVEAEIDACPDVAKSVVFRAPDAATLTAVIVPRNPEDSAAKRRIERFVDQMNGHAVERDVGAVLFAPEPFSRENGFLRPNLKPDRRRIAQHYAASVTAVNRTHDGLG